MSRLVVAMIVKNEEKMILKTLNSCIKYIDKFYISDTGSTDNTVDIIKLYFQGTNKLRLIETKFVDFSTDRNKILDVIEKEEDKNCNILALDANDEAVNCDALVKYLKENPLPDVYFITQVWLDGGKKLRYKTERLFKNSPNIRYDGMPVHEHIKGINGKELNHGNLVDNFYLYQNRDIDVDSLNIHKSKSRLERDYILLLKAHNKNKNDTRVIYYLAQTCYFSQRLEEAKKYFELRFKNREHDEEVYQSYLFYAKACYFLKEPFEKIEEYLWKANEFSYKMQMLFPNLRVYDIEPLSTLVAEYYSIGDYRNAYLYVNQICAVPEPETVLPCDTSIYQYKRWYITAKICEKMNDYLLGYNACNNALLSEDVKEVHKYYNETKLKSFQKNLVEQVEDLNILRRYFKTKLDTMYHKISDKPVFVIFGGWSYHKWDGNSIKNGKGLGGAETSAVKIAENMVKNGYTVLIFADTEERSTINGVEYLKITDYNGFVNTHHIDVLVVLRYIEGLKYGYNIKSVYLWLQDVDHIGNQFVYNPTLKGIITLCNTHAEYYKNKHMPPELHHLVKVIGNGIEYERFCTLDMYNKKKNRFIYSSCPTRGLEFLVEIFPDIKKILPDAELHIFSNFNTSYAKQFENVQELEKKLLNNKDSYIILHDRVSQDKLAEEIMISDFWLYPTTFTETYCITALEMLAGGTHCIATELWALKEVVSEERGTMLKCPEFKQGEKLSEESKIKFKNEILDIVQNLEKNKDIIDKKRKNGIEYAKQQTWSNLVKKWISLIS